MRIIHQTRVNEGKRDCLNTRSSGLSSGAFVRSSSHQGAVKDGFHEEQQHLERFISCPSRPDRRANQRSSVEGASPEREHYSRSQKGLP